MKLACALVLDMFGMHYAHLDGDAADRRTRIWCASGWWLLAITMFFIFYKNWSHYDWSFRLAQWAWNTFGHFLNEGVLAFLFLLAIIPPSPIVWFLLLPLFLTAVLALVGIGFTLLGFAAVLGYHNRSDLEAAAA